MPRRHTEETVRVHFHIFKRDKERLEQYFGRLGVGPSVRTILRNVLNKIEQAKADQADAAATLDVQLPEELTP